MALLVFGLVVFLGIHMVPALPALRASVAGRLGENRYKGLFSLVSAVGLISIIWGYAIAPRGEQLLAPSAFARQVAPLVMIVSFILLAAANMPSHLRRALRHPMLIGIGLWALVHLLANGHVKATLLFGAFLAYTALDLGSVVARGAVRQFAPQWKFDFLAVVSGVALALLVMLLHRVVFGVAPVPWSL
jgi:uncharacterized membrane protein